MAPSPEPPAVHSLEYLSWSDVAELRQRTNVAIIPIGQVAQHGVHLPLGTDGFQVLEVARRIVRRLEANDRTALIAPLIPFGLSPSHREFPGCLNLRPETLTNLLVDIAANLVRDGFDRIVLFNGNGGNWAAVDSAAFHIPEQTGARVFVVGFLETVGYFRREVLESVRAGTDDQDGHAGELETSCMLAIAPRLVHAERASAHTHPIVSELNGLPFSGLNWNSRRRTVGLVSTRAFSPDGHWGHPELASAEKGEQLLERCADVLARHFLTYVFDQHEVEPARRES